MAFAAWLFGKGDEVHLQSKSGQPLARYFPDLVTSLRAIGAKQFVLDGEIVIPIRGRLSFDDLLMRIHPAASRVRKLAAEHPAMFVIFDLLASERGKSLIGLPLKERRRRLEAFADKYLDGRPEVRLSPASGDLHRQEMVQVCWRESGRHRGQTGRPAVPVRAPRWNAKNQTPPHRRLCCWRLSLCRRKEGRGLTVIRTLR